MLQERIDKANIRRELHAEETSRLAKLEVTASKLKRRGNMQNRQLQTWLSGNKCSKIEIAWQDQLERPSEFKEEPSDLKSCEKKLN